MTDYKMILKGYGTFIGALAMIVVLNYIVPTLVSVGESIFSSNTDISGIIWFGLIVLYVLAGVVMPLVFIYMGITAPEEPGNNIVEIILACLMFLFNLLLTFKGYYIVTSIASMIEDGFVLAIFWVGLIAIWLATTFITPAYVIIKHSQQTG